MLFFLFFLITGLLAYSLHILAKPMINRVYAELDTKNVYLRKIQAFFIAIFRIIAY